jgi:hypothetical protein
VKAQLSQCDLLRFALCHLPLISWLEAPNIVAGLSGCFECLLHLVLLLLLLLLLLQLLLPAVCCYGQTMWGNICIKRFLLERQPGMRQNRLTRLSSAMAVPV